MTIQVKVIRDGPAISRAEYKALVLKCLFGTSLEEAAAKLLRQERAKEAEGFSRGEIDNEKNNYLV